MRLRPQPDGSTIVVLEAPDIGAINRVIATLMQTASIVGDESDTLGKAALVLEGMIEGHVPGVEMPKKRKAKESEAPDTTDTVPGESHIIEESSNGDRKATLAPCPKCKRALTASELRRGGSCFECQPVNS